MSSDNNNLPPSDSSHPDPEDDHNLENQKPEDDGAEKGTSDPRPVFSESEGPVNPLVPQVGSDGHLYLPDGTKLLQLPIEDEMKALVKKFGRKKPV